jgi:hypothetical protein
MTGGEGRDGVGVVGSVADLCVEATPPPLAAVRPGRGGGSSTVAIASDAASEPVQSDTGTPSVVTPPSALVEPVAAPSTATSMPRSERSSQIIPIQPAPTRTASRLAATITLRAPLRDRDTGVMTTSP